MALSYPIVFTTIRRIMMDFTKVKTAVVEDFGEQKLVIYGESGAIIDACNLFKNDEEMKNVCNVPLS
jgi:hypothetical protein